MVIDKMKKHYDIRDGLKILMYLLDSIFCIFTPSEFNYMSYGYSIKKN